MAGGVDLLYADDLEPGQVFQLATYVIERDEMVEFARKWDPMPMHIDEHAAAATPIGELFASGSYVWAVNTWLGHHGFVGKLEVHAGIGVDEMRFHKPVKVGMVLSGTVTVEAIEERGNGRVPVWFRTEICDDTGDRVLSYRAGLSVRRRPFG